MPFLCRFYYNFYLMFSTKLWNHNSDESNWFFCKIVDDSSIKTIIFQVLCENDYLAISAKKMAFFLAEITEIVPAELWLDWCTLFIFLNIIFWSNYMKISMTAFIWKI